MRRERIVILLAALLAVGAGLAWISVETEALNPLISEIEPGQFYTLDVQSEQSSLKLPFEKNTRYVLLVSSLGYYGKSHEVELKASLVESKNTTKPLRLTAQPIEPFRPARFSKPSIANIDSVVTRAAEKKISQGSSRAKTRKFYLHVTDGDLNDPKQYARVTARLVGEGRAVCVYLDRQQQVSELSPGFVEEIIYLLDEKIIPEAKQKLGQFRDVDKDGKFSVFITPWLGRLQGGRTSLGGFVRSSDFRDDLKSPFSNRCDMMYLNSNVQSGNHLYDLLSHEYTHAVCFSERLKSAREGCSLPDEEDWLNEAMAHLSEPGTTNIDYRISQFLNAPQQYPLIVSDYYSAGLWRNHGCRGATFLFLRWCADQFGEGLRKRLIHNPVQGRRNLEWATGTKFDELFRRWSIAMLKSGMQDPSASTHSTLLEPIQLASYSKQPQNRESRIQQKSCFDDNASFTSIDLHNPLKNWGLAGPRRVSWDVDAGSHKIQMKGTSTYFLELQSSGSPGVRDICLQGEYGSKLQVTLVKLENGWPSIKIEVAEIFESHENSITNSVAADVVESVLQLQVNLGDFSDMQVEFLSCEHNDGKHRQSFCFGPEEIRILSMGTLDEDGNSIMTVATSLSAIQPTDNPLMVKLVMRDHLGRRAVAWATIDNGYIVMQ